MKTMRPLIHPSIEDITVEGILHALADPVRVAIYAELASSSLHQYLLQLPADQRPQHPQVHAFTALPRAA
jgi:hypothetical protein